MDQRLSRWWPPRGRLGRLSQDRGEAMFQGLRVRLTLWYCGVLGAALVLFGVALYLGAQYFLLTPIENAAAAQANEHVGLWLRDSPLHACPLLSAPRPFGPPPLIQGTNLSQIILCFDQSGTLPASENTTGLPPAFFSNSLAVAALQQGQQVHSVIDGGGTFGQMYFYAQIVPDPAENGVEGVVEVGESIQVQQNVLSQLLLLLLSIGGIALLGAGLGGLFLSNRALVPTRQAWANQQRFIADAAHELRTPLTLLRADAEVLLRRRNLFAEDDAVLLEDIVAETSHMATLANNMLTLARLDSRSSHQEHEVVNLTKIVHMGARRIQALADQMHIRVEEDVNETVMVIGDQLLLEQAVLALLDNAIKYNRPEGSVTLSVITKEKQVFLEVCDTGIGIAAEHLPHLGERFYRVDKARSREAGGTGLGLSIARRIAIAHGGQLSLASVAGQGTTVTLALPLTQGMSPTLKNDQPNSPLSLPNPTV